MTLGSAIDNKVESEFGQELAWRTLPSESAQICFPPSPLAFRKVLKTFMIVYIRFIYVTHHLSG